MTLWATNYSRVDIPSTLTRQVWDANTARALPGVGRALSVYAGLISGCPLRHTKRGEILEDRPRLLDRPDPDMARPTFVSVHLEDYLLQGNAVHLVTARDSYGYPAAVRWYPAHRWAILEDRDRQPIYHLDGRPVNREDVVHVARGADPVFPWRGVGVVEQHVRSLNRAGLEEEAEARNLTERGTPAVAIITPQVEPNQTDLDAAADKWVERFGGSTAPQPAFFPKDTQIIPLSWNPKDAQMIEARRMSLQDVANIFNLDGYWVGAGAPSYTYRSPGAMFLAMLKMSLNPVMDVFEDVWSARWYPLGNGVAFDRKGLLQDDLLTMVQAFSQGAGYFPDPNEPRRYMGFPALPDDAWPAPIEPTPPDPEPDPEPEPPADPVADPGDGEDAA